MTLDAGGNPDAVFIFQIDAAMNTTAGITMNLAGKAKPSNVFWQVLGAVTTGANSNVVGTFLTHDAVTFGAGTHISGRAFSTHAAVTVPGSSFTGALHEPATTVSLSGGNIAVTSASTPTISGTTDAQPGDKVSVAVGGQTLSTTVGSDQKWSVTAAAISEGSHLVTVTVTDSSGNVVTATQTLTVDTTAEFVTVTGGRYNVVSTETPLISGTTDLTVGSQVDVTVAGQNLRATVASDGRWSIIPKTLAQGENVIVATVTDSAGNSGSFTQTLTVDTIADAIAIDGGVNDLGNDSTPTISGTTTAPIGSTVSISVETQSLTAVVGVSHTWSVTVVSPSLADGTHDVVATVTDLAGNLGSFSQVLTVDTLADSLSFTGGVGIDSSIATPTVAGTTTAPEFSIVSVTISPGLYTVSTRVLSDKTWSVLLPALPEGTFSVLATISDAAGNSTSASQFLTVDTTAESVTIDGGAVRLVSDTTPTLWGTTDLPAGNVVGVVVAGQNLLAFVGDSGRWSVTTGVLPQGGPYFVTATVTDASGNQGSFIQSLTVDSLADSVSIEGGTAVLTNDVTPTVSGTTTAPTGSQVSVVVAGQVLTATVASDGAWSVTADVLGEGRFDAVATVTDAAGNVGSFMQTLTIDTTPDVLTINGGPALAGNDATPVISGTSGQRSGEIVSIQVDAESYSAIVQDNGTWTYKSPVLSEGAHIIVVSITDAAGNATTKTQNLTITLVPSAALSLDLGIGGTVAGAPVSIVVANMMPNSAWTLTMHSSPVVVARGFTDRTGSISLSANLPHSVETGSHRLILDSINPNGDPVEVVQYVNIAPGGSLSYASDVVNPDDATIAGATPISSAPPANTARADSNTSVSSSYSSSRSSSPSSAASKAMVPTPIANAAPSAHQSAIPAADSVNLCLAPTDSQDVTLPAAAAVDRSSAGHRGTSRVDGTPIPLTEGCLGDSLSASSLDLRPLTPTSFDDGSIAISLIAIAIFGLLALRRRRQRREHESAKLATE